jgi:hypothetical protein
LERWVNKSNDKIRFGNSYNDDERCIAAGYDNGDLKIFDLR